MTDRPAAWPARRCRGWRDPPGGDDFRLLSRCRRRSRAGMRRCSWRPRAIGLRAGLSSPTSTSTISRRGGAAAQHQGGTACRTRALRAVRGRPPPGVPHRSPADRDAVALILTSDLTTHAITIPAVDQYALEPGSIQRCRETVAISPPSTRLGGGFLDLYVAVEDLVGDSLLPPAQPQLARLRLLRSVVERGWQAGRVLIQPPRSGWLRTTSSIRSRETVSSRSRAQLER